MRMHIMETVAILPYSEGVHGGCILSTIRCRVCSVIVSESEVPVVMPEIAE